MDAQANAKWLVRTEALHKLVPDPLTIFTDRDITSATQRRIIKQRRSRSLIHCCARQLVSEQGLDSVHMNDVAERAGVSIQTVYNLVGTRHEMISSATNEWLVSMAQNAQEVGLSNDLNVCFTMMELFWAASISQRSYASRLIQSRAHERFLERSSVVLAKQLIAGQLRILRGADKIVRWVDAGLLAESLAMSAQNCINAWIAKPYNENRFRTTLINSCGLTLRGALVGEEAARLERSFDESSLSLPLAQSKSKAA